MDPADFVQELFDGLDREIQTGVREVQDWIEAQAHGAAVQLLDAVMPPIVHAGNTAVKASESVIVHSASAGVEFALNSADVGNAVLAGAVAQTVQRGIGEMKTQGDYRRGTDSIAW